jgi:mono/diheme cytochrome c family protein
MKKLKTTLTVLVLSASSIALAGCVSGDPHNDVHGAGDMHSQESHWMAPSAEAGRTNPIVANVASIEMGKSLFQQNCASCHGINADGTGMAGMMLNPKPANLRVMSGQHPDGDFAWKIREGRGAMPSWKSQLSDDQVWHLVNYIQNLSQQPVSGGDQNGGHGHSDGHGHGH